MKATPVALLALLACGASAVATEIALLPTRDNTLYAPNSETNSNGGGATLGAGTNGLNEPRRGLLLFDLSAVPAQAIVESATLTLTLARGPSADEPRPVSLHRVLASWGENQASDAGSGSGAGFGVPAAPGDATWLLRFFGSEMAWATPGGDFAATASATTFVPSAPDTAHVWSGAGLTADVRAWLADPAGNFGWLVRGDETIDRTNRQFFTRESTTPGTAPTLRVTYSVLSVTAMVPEPGGGWRVHFAGSPGRTHTVAFTPGIAPANWTPLGTRTADAEGRFSIVDVPPPGTASRFYRATLP